MLFKHGARVPDAKLIDPRLALERTITFFEYLCSIICLSFFTDEILGYAIEANDKDKIRCLLKHGIYCNLHKDQDVMFELNKFVE